MQLFPPTPDNIVRAAEALRRGDVVAYPTETVYGLGVDPLNSRALEKLIGVKHRDPANPMLLIAASREQVKALTGDLSPRAAAYADAFWPGPLSMLLKPIRRLQPELTGRDGRICIRCTSSPIAAALCETFGGAIVSTSANVSAQPPALSARDVPTAGVVLCLDAGTLPAAAPSTVLDPETGEVLREGAITRAQIAQTCQ